MDDNIIKEIIQSIKNKKINKYYLGVFSIKEFNHLDTRHMKHFALILFIHGIYKNLGHFVSVFKAHGKFYFVDSYGNTPTFYKKKIINKYFKFDYCLKIKLQTDYTTVCGAYAIFFVHLFNGCNFDVECVVNIFLKVFNPKKLIINDKYIVRYIFHIYPRINNNECQILFCNSNFIINYEKCKKNIYL